MTRGWNGSKGLTLVVILCAWSLGACRPAIALSADAAAPRRILLIGGPPDGHRPGTHEYAKSVLLLRDHLAGLSDAAAGRFVVETSENGWPENPAAIERADTIALFSSGSDRREQDHPLLVGDHMEEVAKAMARGCGLVTFHYSTFAPNRIGPRILEWTGGYFDYESGPGPRNWYSRINTWQARLEPATPAHPISQGVEPFTIKEEIYWRIRFRDDDPRLVPILKTVAPGEPEPQTVAWAVERADGGRGFGFTGGHFFAHWQNDSFRQLMANAVLWTAKAEPAPQAAARPDAKQTGTARPNVVVILADDLGWGDVTCYNPESKIITPRIDALAADGLRMTNAYTPASVCSPTRYGLLTGRYPWRTWHKEGVLYHYDPSLIRPGRMTLGTLCQQQGYATAAVGKWHVGLDWQPVPGDPGDWMVGQPIRYADKRQTAARIDFTKPITVGPREIGFDHFFGSVHQGRDDHVVRDSLRIPGFVAKPSNHDDLFVEDSIAFIEDCRRLEPAKPFFLYLPLGSPHHGREVPPRLNGKSGDGVRGDRVLWVDESVGRILDVLEKQGIADETIVIFTSDNGASDNRRLPGGNPEHHPNGPYRGFKTDVWDGGYRVPFIVRWPGTIKPGSTAEQVVCLTDVLATLAEVEGVPLPAWAGEDSYSMLPAWRGGTEPVRESLVLQSYKGVLSIREGRWKLVLGTEGSGGHRGVTAEWTPIQTGWERVGEISVGQLYDLENDPSERTNLFNEHPDIVGRLRTKLDKIVAGDRSRPLSSGVSPGGKPALRESAALRADGIVGSSDVAPVWAGHSVGFALLTTPDRQYVAFYAADRHLTVASRAMGSSVWEFFPLPSEQAEPPRLGQNETSAVVGWDSHNSIAMAIDSAGHVHVAGNMHGNGLTYWRTREPGAIASFEQVKQMVGRDEERCTYPVFLTRADGRLVFQYRSGRSGMGSTFINLYDVESRAWQRLVDGPVFNGEKQRNAYPLPPVAGPDGMFHVSWVWRESPDAGANHDLSYARSRDLAHWEDAAGRPLALPITLATEGVIVDPVPVQGGILNGTGQVGFDSRQRPVLAYYKYDPAGHSQAFVARWEGSAWKVVQLSDWDHRFDLAGGGTLPAYDINLGAVQPGNAGELRLEFRHVKAGSGVWVLDDSSLAVLRTEPGKPRYPRSLWKVESAFPGMGVRYADDSGTAEDPGRRFILRWESLGSNRDQPRPEPWPEPSMLRVVELRAPSP